MVGCNGPQSFHMASYGHRNIVVKEQCLRLVPGSASLKKNCYHSWSRIISVLFRFRAEKIDAAASAPASAPTMLPLLYALQKKFSPKKS
jgi:hypothetical protein